MRKKIRRIKRGLAVMLSVCMVFSVAPIQAGAEENDSEIAVQANDSAVVRQIRCTSSMQIRCT